MKIALIIPICSSDNEKSFYDYRFYSKFLFSRKYISYLLAIPTLTALTPAKHEIRVFDENIEDIDYEWDADLVGISVRTMYAKRAYAISDRYRNLGIITVLGGIHPSMCSEEALQHCDSVVIGEAEQVWEVLLVDAEKKLLKKTYQAENLTDLSLSPVADRKAMSKDLYLSDIVQTTKGCPFHCEFCSVHAYDGQRIRSKSVEQVVNELQTISNSSVTYKKKHAIFFADDNIIANKKFALELFAAIKPLNINWMCQASINISRDDDLLKLMRDSGCGAIFIGFESISQENLSSMDKGINKRYDYLEAINKIQSHGILVHSSFIVGYDYDSEKTFRELSEFIRESRLLMPLINILTPFPGTKLFRRLSDERKILHTDWSKYDTKHVVFNHPTLSSEELYDGYRSIVRDAYSYESIFSKLNYYWSIDFWKRSNDLDSVKFKYRLLFAIRLCTLLFSPNMDRSKFILKILPYVFRKHVRISTILSLMAYNDFAYSL
ncbi:MAG: B12-binding domain-containing radical SAM protein [Nitrospiraceae bacterium]|nr:MAG: B12-binding domain-containing radical SAM protein [Nitrospiraceae bacterium]